MAVVSPFSGLSEGVDSIARVFMDAPKYQGLAADRMLAQAKAQQAQQQMAAQAGIPALVNEAIRDPAAFQEKIGALAQLHAMSGGDLKDFGQVALGLGAQVSGITDDRLIHGMAGAGKFAGVNDAVSRQGQEEIRASNLANAITEAMSKPINVGMGAKLVIPSTGQVIAEGNTPAAAGGGVIGALADQLMADNPDMTRSDAIYAAQTGYRQGTRLDQGNVTPMPGAVDTRGAFKQAEGMGKATAKANVDLPKIIDSSNRMLSVLNQAIDHPGMKYATGYGSLLPILPDSKQAEFVALTDQLKGGGFLQAYDILRGTGQITEIEGIKGENAISRINNTRVGSAAYNQALKDLRAVVQTAVKAAKSAASGAFQPGGAIPGGSASPPGGGLTPDEQRELQELEALEAGGQ